MCSAQITDYTQQLSGGVLAKHPLLMIIRTLFRHLKNIQRPQSWPSCLISVSTSNRYSLKIGLTMKLRTQRLLPNSHCFHVPIALSFWASGKSESNMSCTLGKGRSTILSVAYLITTHNSRQIYHRRILKVCKPHSPIFAV